MACTFRPLSTSVGGNCAMSPRREVTWEWKADRQVPWDRETARRTSRESTLVVPSHIGSTYKYSSVRNSRVKVTSQQGKDLEKVTCPASI
jgi:hypothetical protein